MQWCNDDNYDNDDNNDNDNDDDANIQFISIFEEVWAYEDYTTFKEQWSC